MLENTIGSEILITLIAALTLVLVVLLPLLPAILIYKIFPDEKISTRGALGAFTWNATGAFAGYIIVLVIITTTQLKSVVAAIGVTRNPAWIVELDIHGYDTDGNRKNFPDLIVSLNPAIHRVSASKVVLRLPGLGKQDWPTVGLTIPGGGGKSDINLAGYDESEMEVDSLNKRVKILSPVVIRQIATAEQPYQYSEHVEQ